MVSNLSLTMKTQCYQHASATISGMARACWKICMGVVACESCEIMLACLWMRLGKCKACAAKARAVNLNKHCSLTITPLLPCRGTLLPCHRSAKRGAAVRCSRR